MKIIKKIFAPLFFDVPVTFEFNGSIEDGVRLLSKNIFRFSWDNNFCESLIGKVAASDVTIYRYNLASATNQTGVIPTFYGKFSYQNGKAVLTGSFRLHKIAKWGYIFGVIGIPLFYLYLIAQDNKLQSTNFVYVLISWVIIYIAFIAIMQFGYLRGSNDITYIVDRVTK